MIVNAILHSAKLTLENIDLLRRKDPPPYTPNSTALVSAYFPSFRFLERFTNGTHFKSKEKTKYYFLKNLISLRGISLTGFDEGNNLINNDNDHI